MRRDEDGALWLFWREWIPWVMGNHPERILDRVAARPAPTQAELDAAVRAEAKQWRAGRAQGVLARSSPLRAELAAKERTG